VSQQQLLIDAVRALETAGVPYMLTGSVVSSYYGEPRATHDFDFVVSLGEVQLSALHASLSALDGHIDEVGMRRALRGRSMFNFIDHVTGLKVDFWIIGREPYDDACFARRRTESLFGTKMAVASPEDIILIKLRWAKRMGGSVKQFRDALRVYEVQRPTLDFAYIESWLDPLDVRHDWDRIRREALPID
jgi:hypothetical protein